MGRGDLMEQGLDRGVREAVGMFADELSEHRYLERLLWPNGVCCPRCRSTARVGKLDGAAEATGVCRMGADAAKAASEVDRLFLGLLPEAIARPRDQTAKETARLKSRTKRKVSV